MERGDVGVDLVCYSVIVMESLLNITRIHHKNGISKVKETKPNVLRANSLRVVSLKETVPRDLAPINRRFVDLCVPDGL